MTTFTLDPTNEKHIKAVAEALFDHEPRNRAKRFRDQHADVQYRYIDKASWVLSMAAQAIDSAPTIERAETGR